MQKTIEIYTAETLDRLLIVPSPNDDRHEVRSTLRKILGDIPLKTFAEGISLPSKFVPLLLNCGTDFKCKWRGESKLYAENRARTFSNISRIRGEIENIKNGSASAAQRLISDLPDLEKLDDHQKINIAAMTHPQLPGLCIFDEQGTGKTISVIFAFDLLVHRDEVDIVLVFAPKSMVSEWPVDLNRFKGDLYKCVMITGNRDNKRLAINSDADVFVTNYETAVSMKLELAALLRRYNGRAMIVVDESFYVKNLDTKRTKAIRQLREYCSRGFVLCGTPAPNSPHDLVQQFNIVDFGSAFDGVSLPEDRQLARPFVQNIINERGLFIRHLKQDVLPNLPTKRYTRVVIPLEEHQRRLYTAALQNLILDINSTDNHTFQRARVSFLAKRSALLQICSNPIALVDQYSEVPAKIRALDDILADTIGKKREKVILWSFYTRSIDAIMARYRQYDPVRYDGSVTAVADRRSAVRRFQEDDKTMLFVANPAAAGAGLTLHRSCIAIYESLSNQAAHYLQSIDRIHRRGQSREVEYLILLCDNTIEIDEYDRLLHKEKAGQELLGDHVDRAITREMMLSEAIKALAQMGARCGCE